MTEAEERRRLRREWRHLASGGSLVAIVATILFLGALHETARVPEEPTWETLARTPASSSAPSAALPSVLEATTSVPEPGLDPLGRRILEDPLRIARHPRGFTLQLAVACKRETASRIVERAKSSPRLFVLPAALGAQDCFRFCWGAYASREEAVRATDLPAELRAEVERPAVRRIEEVQP